MSYVSTVSWPKRAVVTAGMPYGNKKLHFGHVAGVFVPADAYARFLRDRLGARNVLFVSGTDCFGSPIQEGYRKACENEGFEGSIEDYVRRNHDAQKATLDAYGISLSIYEGSGLGRAGEVHRMVTDAVLRRLHENGHLNTMETLQFYDAKEGVFLNGRQVLGRCPVQGCKSEKAYADECDLGHQFNPEDLINPISTLSGEVPEMRPVRNWYFDLPNFHAQLQELADGLAADEEVRPVVVKGAKEFLVPPVMYIKNDLEDDYRAIADKLPAHVFHEAEKGKQSFEIEFACIEDRDKARDVLFEAGVRFRTGKALVPFRISGNVEWGVPVPELDGVEGLTVWCWPESLWAPISFSAAALESRGEALDAVRDWWCSPDARVYQFIGQDNLYFYGVAQPALWVGLEEGNAMQAVPAAGQLQQTRLIANHHILFGKTKASSSGAVKPPSADDLLEYYTAEQLRAHWLGLGLDQKSVGFKPKPFDPDESKREDPRVADPALKEGALLTNVFNRLARSCFYEAQKSFEGLMPLGSVSAEVVERA
ncbi:MAG: class I tRNA ligase family protein, partial [Slackia piriformis]|nr:class I tRNA ligase family protein [Slackia piriformis]